MKKHQSSKAGFFLFIYLLGSSALKAQDFPLDGDLVDTITIYDDLFESEAPIHLILKFDIKEYQRTRSSEEYKPAELTYILNNDDSIRHTVRIRSRGDFRKNYCTLPPFWINIKYAGINSDELAEVKKMKLVTHCMRSRHFSDYVLKEYLVYRLYNIITPYSFRVRLVRMRYIDTGRENRETENWAILIEPEELLAERLNATFIKNDKLAMRNMNAELMDRLALFQYMIGNTDYSVTGRHNIKILRMNADGPAGYIPVPYDFDYTGFVNTNYAKPADGTNLEKVTDRYFMGPCRSEEIHLKYMDEMFTYKDEFLDFIQPFEYLELDEKIEILRFLENFYTEISSDRFFERRISNTCR